MATTLKTPGVFIEEISTLPASVAAVDTAIPAFIGSTEKSIKNGAIIPINTPVRITSLVEFEDIFGRSFNEQFTVTLGGSTTSEEDTSISVAATTALSDYSLHYNMQMYFGNGGGPCYVVSVGDYATAIAAGTETPQVGLLGGLNSVEQIDEVTLLVVPEAITLGSTDRTSINNAMLAQCSKLQDRFAIMDARVNNGTTPFSVFKDGNEFRDEVGSDDLKYGATYYPSLNTALDIKFENADVIIDDNRPSNNNGPFNGQSLADIKVGFDLGAPVAATGTIIIGSVTSMIGDTIKIGDKIYIAAASPASGILEFEVGTLAATATSLKDTINSNLPTGIVSASKPGGPPQQVDLLATPGVAGNNIDLVKTGTNMTLPEPFLNGGNDGVEPADLSLFNNITDEIDKNIVELYPSSSIAGVYARVDAARGVWKAPANVSLRLVSEPNVAVTADEQENLNVDAGSGKSINAIRTFTGKGVLIWGSRTLAGNDNEWRYVPVRRLFIFAEESIQKATEFVVFEPNDANTWLRTRTMIENFLTTLWRQGALAGAKPEDAFFVNVGLGETMSPQDILEGRLIIEVGMAAVRPAEFIVLRFSHKLQVS